MLILENKNYDLYGVVKDVTESSTDTKAVIFELKDSDRVVVRVPLDMDVEIGRIYHVIGTGKPYKQKMHIYMESFVRLNDEELDTEAKESITNSLMGYYKVEYKELENFITDSIDKLENKIVKDITSSIYNEYKDRFVEYPAATKFHHPYKHGLIYHTYNTLRLGLAFTSIYPHLNKDLIVSGIILHDIMKVEEINETSSEYTIKGKLLGHISMIESEILKVANKLGYENEEETLLLRHIVLSHHYEAEYGSPKRSQIIESLIVHLSDMCDAKIEPTIEALEKTNMYQLTDTIQVNNKDKFYKHKLSK